MVERVPPVQTAPVTTGVVRASLAHRLPGFGRRPV